MISKDQLPQNGFYAVIFSSSKSEQLEGYVEMDELTMKKATEQSGYLGYESLSNNEKTIFISYWKDMESINRWKVDSTHKLAKANAKNWYTRYLSQICLVQSHHLSEN